MLRSVVRVGSNVERLKMRKSFFQVGDDQLVSLGVKAASGDLQSLKRMRVDYIEHLDLEVLVAMNWRRPESEPTRPVLEHQRLEVGVSPQKIPPISCLGRFFIVCEVYVANAARGAELGRQEF
jgi:hypothetical protein